MVLTKTRLLKHDFPVHGNKFTTGSKSAMAIVKLYDGHSEIIIFKGN